MNNVNSKAIVIGTFVFLFMYAIHVLIFPLLKDSIDAGNGEAMFALSQMLGVATCFISGYTSARIAGERGFFYGFNVGGLGTVLSAFAAVLWSMKTGETISTLGLVTLPYWIFVNGSLAGFGGLLVINMIEEGKREK